MKIVSFELIMPNRGSWNGKWSGQDNKYYIIEKLSEKYLNNREWFKDLLKDGKDSWHYSWGDGWAANVTAQIIDSSEAKKRRKASKGFCGYDWMVQSIRMYGAIYASHEIPKSTSLTLPE
jgi:hypothetical protein